MKTILLVLCATIVSAGSAVIRFHSTGGTPLVDSFGASVEVDSAGGTGGVAVADFDGDGRDEFAAQHNPLQIYDWNGSSWDTHAIDDATGMLDRFAGDNEALDVDNDGDIDLIVTDTSNTGNTGSLMWYENPGTLAGAWTLTVIDTFSGTGAAQDGNSIRHTEEAVGDLDGDGFQEIVLRDIFYGVWVYANDGAGTFTLAEFIPTNPREGLDLADIDGDGNLDIVLNGVWIETPDDLVSGTWTLHAIDGMEDWYPAGRTTDEMRDYAAKVRCADFNEDGRPDIVISNSEELNGASAGKPHGVRVYLNPVDPINDEWTEVILDADHFSWHTLKVCDINQDNHLDVMAAISSVGVDTEGGHLDYWLGNGDGTFQTAVTIDTELGYQGAVGDFNGDGAIDIALPEHFQSDPIRVYHHDGAPDVPDVTPPVFDTAEINGDQLVINWSEAVTGSSTYLDQFDLDGITGGDNVGISSHDGGNGTSQWTLTTDTAAEEGDTVNLDYAGGLNLVEDNAGNDLASFSDAAVSNNTVPFVYLIKQDFDADGFDNGESWSIGAGSPDPNSPDNAYTGTNSLFTGTGNNHAISPDFAAQSEIWIFGTPVVTTHATSGGRWIMKILDTDSNTLGGINARTTGGGIRIQHGSQTSGQTTITFDLSTRYFWKMRWVKATGAGNDGIAELYVSTTETFPGSPQLTIATGTATADATTIILGGDAGSGNFAIHQDKIRVAAEEIGDSPE